MNRNKISKRFRGSLLNEISLNTEWMYKSFENVERKKKTEKRSIYPTNAAKVATKITTI
jgi:hypothetical protein